MERNPNKARVNTKLVSIAGNSRAGCESWLIFMSWWFDVKTSVCSVLHLQALQPLNQALSALSVAMTSTSTAPLFKRTLLHVQCEP